ncbi:MAG TPA: hypothetical protein PLT07_05425, partial [Trueperaceae bacterium]|nr:hypothetical protein [Trueperaceae bacterium]
AKESLAQTQAEIASLNAAFKVELAGVSATPLQADKLELDSVTIRPTARGVALRFVGVAWVPFLQGADGRWNVRA